MKKIRLTGTGVKAIEKELLKKDYVPVSRGEFARIARTIAVRKKDSVLNIRINSQDLKDIKQKASRLGIRYQTFISEILHKVARA